MPTSTGSYPRLPRLIKPRTLRLSDFPPAIDDWLDSAKLYWRLHYIDSRLPSTVQTVYPTAHGICWVLYGGMGYQERLTSNPTNRFSFPAGVDVSGMLYLPDPESKAEELVIVEGTTDALAIHLAGYRAVSSLGTMLTAQRAKLLQSLVRDTRRVFYIPDNDSPGLHAINRYIREGIGIQVRYLPKGCKDMCDLTREEREVFLGVATQAC